MFENLQREFGVLVRKGREKLGLTQEMTAELLEIGNSNLRNIEQGKGRANWEDWLKLSELLSINLDALQRKHLAQFLREKIKVD